MNDDSTLIHRFVADRSEAAFTELVQRHLSLVHATALRRVGGDAHLAQDVTQMVFISLARKASSLTSHASISGWLYISTHHASAEIVRSEQRRKQREGSAHAMHLASTSDEQPVDPARLYPLLDDALVELKPDDREAVLLRFFAQRSFAEIGSTLRVTEEAARKRVDRALEKLQSTLSRRGITSTVTALSTALTAVGTTLAPATLASSVTAAALAQTMVAPVAAFTASLSSALLPATAIAALLTGLWTILPQQRATAAIADELARLESTPGDAARVQAEIVALQRALALAGTSVASAALATSTVPPAMPAPATPARMAGAKEVFVDTEGRLKWEGQPVRLDDFLVRVAEYQATSPRASQLIIKGNGARIGQMYYVLVEARKAGITSLVVESDSQPEREPWIPMTWF